MITFSYSLVLKPLMMQAKDSVFPLPLQDIIKYYSPDSRCLVPCHWLWRSAGHWQHQPSNQSPDHYCYVPVQGSGSLLRTPYSSCCVLYWMPKDKFIYEWCTKFLQQTKSNLAWLQTYRALWMKTMDHILTTAKIQWNMNIINEKKPTEDDNVWKHPNHLQNTKDETDFASQGFKSFNIKHNKSF